jgi:amidase
MSSKKQPWQGVSQNYRASIAAKIPEPLRLHASFVQPISPSSPQSVIEIPRICGLLTQKEIDITENYEAVSLLEKIAKRELSSYAVTTAFCKRAAISQQLVRMVFSI